MMMKQHTRSLFTLLLLAALLLTAGCAGQRGDPPQTERLTAPRMEAEDGTRYRETKAPDPPPPPPDDFDYSLPVPLSAPKDRSWLDGTVFLGDSRTDGLILFTGLSKVVSYAYTSLNVETVFTKKVVENGFDAEGNTQYLTVTEALRERDGWDRVYIMFGTNELGWNSVYSFISQYRTLIRYVRSLNPYAEIYVESILPMGKECEANPLYFNSDRVREFNAAIREMTEAEKVYYVDVAEVMTDEEGNLPKEAAQDGIHPGRAYCGIWLDYLLQHTVQ